MKKFVLFIVALVFLSGACKQDPPPGNAIPRDKFVDILVDVHLAEGIYDNRKLLRMDTLSSSELYLAVLKKYQVTKEEMLTTSLYYSRHQKEYDKIYADVLSRISLMIEEQNEKKGKKPEKKFRKK